MINFIIFTCYWIRWTTKLFSFNIWGWLQENKCQRSNIKMHNNNLMEWKTLITTPLKRCWKPTIFIDFHNEIPWIIWLCLLKQCCEMSWLQRLFLWEESFPRDGSPEGLWRREGDAWTWKVCNLKEYNTK